MIRKLFVLALLLTSGAPGLRAQGGANVIAFSSPMNIEFMNGPIAFDGEPVAGAPYSAEAITDVVQTLADGNRIVRQNKAQIARDGQGRTRREQGFAMFGPLVNGPAGGDEPRHVQISDPTTGTMVMLDLQNKVAHKMPAPHMVLKNKMAGAVGWAAGAAVSVKNLRWPAHEPAGAGANVIYHATPPLPARGIAGQPCGRTGCRAARNDVHRGRSGRGRSHDDDHFSRSDRQRTANHHRVRTLDSSDLKVLVMSKQSDPRFGETTYRLTNLTRGEPPPQLFEVPADFQVVDAAANRDVIFERKIVK